MKVDEKFFVRRGRLVFLVMIGNDNIYTTSNSFDEIVMEIRQIVKAKFIRCKYHRDWEAEIEKDNFPRNAVGISIFNPSDKYDKEFGINLALDRCVKIVHQAYKQKMLREVNANIRNRFAGSGYDKEVVRSDKS